MSVMKSERNRSGRVVLTTRMRSVGYDSRCLGTPVAIAVAGAPVEVVAACPGPAVLGLAGVITTGADVAAGGAATGGAGAAGAPWDTMIGAVTTGAGAVWRGASGAGSGRVLGS